MFNFILKKAMPIPRMDSYDSYLFVAPHPDDIEVGAGGSVATLIAMGKKVTFVIATDGSVGSIDTSIGERELVAKRQQESIESANILGVSDVIFLPYQDGGMYNTADMTASLAKVILDVNPDVVVTTDYKVPSECHPDHIKVGQCTTEAYFACLWGRLTERLGLFGTANIKALAFYYTDKPNAYVSVGKTFDKKMQAIQCHKSQFDMQGIQDIKTYFTLRNIRYGIKSGKGRAEAFRLLTNMHMHCMPEVSSW